MIGFGTCKHLDIPGNMPGAMMLSLQEDTRLYTYGWQSQGVLTSDEKVLTLGVGDLLLFRGDLVHAGAEYTQQNTRVHVYLDIKGIKRSSDTTNLLRIIDAKSGTMALPSGKTTRFFDPSGMHECPMCGKTFSKPNSTQRHINRDHPNYRVYRKRAKKIKKKAKGIKAKAKAKSAEANSTDGESTDAESTEAKSTKAKASRGKASNDGSQEEKADDSEEDKAPAPINANQGASAAAHVIGLANKPSPPASVASKTKASVKSATIPDGKPPAKSDTKRKGMPKQQVIAAAKKATASGKGKRQRHGGGVYNEPDDPDEDPDEESPNPKRKKRDRKTTKPSPPAPAPSNSAKSKVFFNFLDSDSD